MDKAISFGGYLLGQAYQPCDSSSITAINVSDKNDNSDLLRRAWHQHPLIASAKAPALQ